MFFVLMLCLVVFSHLRFGLSLSSIHDHLTEKEINHRSLKLSKRRPNQAHTKSVLPEVGVIDQCVAIYGDLQGAVVNSHQISGGTTKELDTRCCKLCAEDPLCDFWVRSAENTPNQECWLKNAFTGYILDPPKPPHCCNVKPGANCPLDQRCVAAKPLRRGNFMMQAYAGVIFINMPWNGGFVVQRILEHYANKFGLRALRSTNCEDASNDILNQSASCCAALMLSEYEYPAKIFPTGSPQSYQMLYQSTHYNPGALSMYMDRISYQRKIIIFRHPLDVLESIFFSAALQRKRVYTPSLEVLHDAEGLVKRSYANTWAGKRKRRRRLGIENKNHTFFKNENISVSRRDEMDRRRRKLINFHGNSLVTPPKQTVPLQNTIKHEWSLWPSSSSSSSKPSPFLNMNSNDKQGKKVNKQKGSTMVEEKEEQLDPVGDLKEEEDVYDSDDVLCSSIAIDFLGWLEKCPLVARGDYSILQFIDKDAHEALREALKTDPTIPPPVRGPLLKRAQERIQSDFTIGMSDKLDTSILLFEKVLGLSRADILYSRKSMLQSPYEGPSELILNQFTPMSEDWRGEEKREDFINFLKMRGTPILYHMHLYESARAVYTSQVARYLGTDKEVQARLFTYHSQVKDFTKCYDNLRELSPIRKDQSGWNGNGNGKKFFQCPEDLYTGSSARKACTAMARSFDADRIAKEREKERDIKNVDGKKGNLGAGMTWSLD